MVATLNVLHDGYAAPTMDRVASTITLIRDGDAVIVVDPGMVADTAMILNPLAELGVGVDMVTDIILSHHHPDHVINIALFPNARVHDVMAIWYRDTLQLRPAEGFHVSESTTLIQTPGHTPQDVSTVVVTDSGIHVLTHLWWMAAGPADDPFSPDRAALRANRTRILDLQPALIIPGHGPAFAPDANTPL